MKPSKIKKDRHVSKRCGGFSLQPSYLIILMTVAQAIIEITTMIAVVNLRACSSVAVTMTDPVKLLLDDIEIISQRKRFSGAFN
jgi:hypothetical protein